MASALDAPGTPGARERDRRSEHPRRRVQLAAPADPTSPRRAIAAAARRRRGAQPPPPRLRGGRDRVCRVRRRAVELAATTGQRRAPRRRDRFDELRRILFSTSRDWWWAAVVAVGASIRRRALSGRPGKVSGAGTWLRCPPGGGPVGEVTVRRWSAADGVALAASSPMPPMRPSVAWSADGQWLAAATAAACASGHRRTPGWRGNPTTVSFSLTWHPSNWSWSLGPAAATTPWTCTSCTCARATPTRCRCCSPTAGRARSSSSSTSSTP